MHRPKHKIIRLKGKKLRELNQRVLERDNYECQSKFCINENVFYPLDVPHHITKKSQGGGDVDNNLISLCVFCHRKVHYENIKITACEDGWTFENVGYTKTDTEV